MPDLLRALILPIGMFAILYFFMIRPQKKQQEKKEEMISNLRVGDNIITIGGIHGVVNVVKEDMITIETSSTKTRLDVSKWAVGTVSSE